MDECLPLGSMDAPTLRMLLEKDREQRQGLEQEIARLQAGLARQNERIIQLEAENAELRRLVAEHQGLITGLQEQNALLRQQVALLEAENTRLRGTPRSPKLLPGAWPSERTKTEREDTPRKQRDERHNRGRVGRQTCTLGPGGVEYRLETSDLHADPVPRHHANAPCYSDRQDLKSGALRSERSRHVVGGVCVQALWCSCVRQRSDLRGDSRLGRSSRAGQPGRSGPGHRARAQSGE